MITLAQHRVCNNCGVPVSGRRGKKFCSDHCRFEASNKFRAENYYTPVVRKITNALQKNRVILAQTLGDEKTVKIAKSKLLELGLNFKYFTHTFVSSENRTYYYCFDYGYTPLKDEWYLIVKQKK